MTPTPFPQGPITAWHGRGVAVIGDDIDTDRIIPARYLKCVTFDNLAAGAFADDRQEQTGAHPFDLEQHRDASILLVNRNFGCGSSREHAPQALMRRGIRALIGESFAEIFFGNCLTLGIPCLTANHDDLAALQALVSAEPATELAIDVEGLHVSAGGQRWTLQLAEGPHRMLVSGHWDGTSQLVAHDAELRATAAGLPYLNGFAA
ncbi:MAG: 3-isopropylmalate dehydratase small subunit [Synechococcaceae cyanobacterium]|nr:3-isopropylmalate dehydratase small subunit [Synechococcaceae cyanobacterium]